MAAEMKACHAHVRQVRKLRSQSVIVAELEMPIAAFKDVVAFCDESDVLLTIAPATMKGLPYGVVASAPAFDEDVTPDAPALDVADPGLPDSGNGSGERRAFSDLPVGSQAAMMCREPEFQKWLGGIDESETRALLCDAFGVGSRADIPLATWTDYYNAFDAWRTEQRYGDIAP